MENHIFTFKYKNELKIMLECKLFPMEKLKNELIYFSKFMTIIDLINVHLDLKILPSLT